MPFLRAYTVHFSVIRKPPALLRLDPVLPEAVPTRFCLREPSAADAMYNFMNAPALIRRMKVEKHNLPPGGFPLNQLLERPNRSIPSLDVVTVVVMRKPVLALVAGFHAILVHKGNKHAVGIVADPVPFRRAREDFVDYALQNETPRRLAGVMASGERKKPFRLFAAANARHFRIELSALRFAQDVELGSVLPAPAHPQTGANKQTLFS